VKKKAFHFTMGVVEDIDRMADAFGKGTAPNDLLVDSWNDLKSLRYSFILVVMFICQRAFHPETS
jgi:hypothetical protein